MIIVIRRRARVNAPGPRRVEDRSHRPSLLAGGDALRHQALRLAQRRTDDGIQQALASIPLHRSRWKTTSGSGLDCPPLPTGFVMPPMSRPPRQHLAAVAVVVDDYDAAIAWYTGVLGFELIEDAPRGPGKRWVVVAPPGSSESRLLLAKAATAAQQARIGDQTGGRVFLFLHTEDFKRDYERLRSHGVVFVDGPREESYGVVGVFQDLYGNRWDLIEPQDRAAGRRSDQPTVKLPAF